MPYPCPCLAEHMTCDEGYFDDGIVAQGTGSFKVKHHLADCFIVQYK